LSCSEWCETRKKWHGEEPSSPSSVSKAGEGEATSCIESFESCMSNISYLQVHFVADDDAWQHNSSSAWVVFS